MEDSPLTAFEIVALSAEGHWKYYFDPAISLLITCIIFSSALPLGESLLPGKPARSQTRSYRSLFTVKSASYILLQGVPSHISLEAVRDAIKSCQGVVSLHEVSSQTTDLPLSRIASEIRFGASASHLATVRKDRRRFCSCHGQPGRRLHDRRRPDQEGPARVWGTQQYHPAGVWERRRRARRGQSVQSFLSRARKLIATLQSSQERACLIRCPPEVCGTDACCPPPGVGQLVDVDGEETAITSESA